MASLARSARAATAKVARPLMQRWFPGTSHPLVISAPMDFVTNARLATEVTKAGGFGFIQGGRDFKPDSALVTKTLDERLSTARALLAGHLGSSRGNDHNVTSTTSATTTLPLGVGFVAYDASALDHFNETTLPILVEHKPGVVWLFAPSPERPETIRKIIESLRKAADTSAAATGSNEAWDLRIAVQVGTVEAARKAVEDGADIIVAQGIDAGGHQFASGAGVVSLVPEIADMLAAMSRESHAREIALWAAGGIADGRGVAAALALGADAAVLGTRYMVAIESDTQDYKRQAILSTSDGGQNTVKAYIHDHVQGNHSWPEVYDGRALIHPSYMDHVAGMTLDENKALFKSARDGGELSRMVIWSGTGVGLIKKEQPAAEITREVREGALAAISRLK